MLPFRPCASPARTTARQSGSGSARTSGFPAASTAWAQRGDKKRAKTTFQTAAQWKPVTDVRADAVMVYGTVDRPGLTFEQRMRSWAEKGYDVQFMTGVAWGDYQDYFLGKWDGVDGHLKEGQRDRQGNEIAHGHLVPYIVPTASFIRYTQQEQVKRVIDAGITSIYLEEPEFWMRGGYSEAFKAEWEKYYGFPWRPQHESPENTYLSNKLKYYLYYNALDEIFTYAKAYGRSKGVEVKCYVPTHSLINYTSWQIVSPEASLASLDCVDGYIAQVWTGTAREPNYYNGVCRERVFENAFLEYGCMESMTAPLGREMYFLTDPIEDRGRDWADYKRNYQATFVAQLMYPQVETYEVMPWPDRIYEGLYRVAGTDRKERIPRDYSTQMQVMINTLNDIRATDSRVEGTHGIGVLMSNSLMFQRFPNHAGYDDPQFSSFYGQTLPLLKRGIPVELVHIENTPFKETLRHLRVLVMSYSNMKPLKPEYHDCLAAWVKKGGVLLPLRPFVREDGAGACACRWNLSVREGHGGGAPSGPEALRARSGKRCALLRGRCRGLPSPHGRGNRCQELPAPGAGSLPPGRRDGRKRVPRAADPHRTLHRPVRQESARAFCQAGGTGRAVLPV